MRADEVEKGDMLHPPDCKPMSVTTIEQWSESVRFVCHDSEDPDKVYHGQFDRDETMPFPVTRQQMLDV